MKPTQVANSKNYRLRQRQKISDLTRRVEDLEGEVRELEEANRDLIARVFDVETENRSLHERLDRMEERLANAERDRDRHKGAMEALLRASDHRPFVAAYNDVLVQLHRTQDRLEEANRALAVRPEHQLGQMTAAMLALIRLKCSPDKLNAEKEETVRVATELVQIVNSVLDLLEKRNAKPG